MIMDWICLFIAGLCEMSFVITMKLSSGFKKPLFVVLTFIFMSISFFLLSVALKTIPIGTGYAVWTGIGAVGSVIAGMFLFKEKKSLVKILFISMIIIGVVGLKLAA